MKTDFPHLPHVHGWLRTEALMFASFYRSKFLNNDNFKSLEIGVHHGKFFIGLENITPLGKKVIAVDVFDVQEKNIDRSGKGNLEIFDDHVARYCLDPQRVQVLAIDSLDVDVSSIGKNQFGLLSIDGGHTANHTMKDLETCNQLVTDNGLIILDDILHQDWAGVVTGAVQYFTSSQGLRIVPFAIGYKKLFCCHFSRKNLVMRQIAESKQELKYLGMQIKKYTEFAGHQIFSLK